MGDLLFSITEKTEILLIMAMPIPVILKLLITRQGHPAIQKSCHHCDCHTPMHLSCPSQLPWLQPERIEHKCAGCFDQQNTPAAIEQRGNKWQREASAKAAEGEMLCTYRNIKGPSPARSSSMASVHSCLSCRLEHSRPS